MVLVCIAMVTHAWGADHPVEPAGLFGVHWWGHTHGKPVDPALRQYLGQRNGWSTETVLTHSSDWWRPEWFTDLYSQLNRWGVGTITRIDYTWDDPIPSPQDSNAGKWPADVASAYRSLGTWSKRWIIGNECNLDLSDKSKWPGRRITPEGYAAQYLRTRRAVHDTASSLGYQRPEVLVAGPSPGPKEGPRWMAGTDWLKRVLSAVSKDQCDGIALHAYGWNVNEFAASLSEQLRLIDGLGFADKPVYISEFNRMTQSASDEVNSAQFLVEAVDHVARWNRNPKNHPVSAMTWFVYDSDQQAGNGWNGYAIEHYKARGKPLWKAFERAVARRHPSVRPVQSAGRIRQSR